jgi:hypothetical protein
VRVRVSIATTTMQVCFELYGIHLLVGESVRYADVRECSDRKEWQVNLFIEQYETLIR